MEGATATVGNGPAQKAAAPVPASALAWVPSEDMDALAWVHVGHRLGVMGRCSQWWLGDWIRYGNMRWGEKYKEAARVTGYDVQTLRNIAYVARQIDVSRRRDNLTWSHHAEVCALEPDEQDRWLDFASDQRMSVADLRLELRVARRLEGLSGSAPCTPRGKAVCPECKHEFYPR